MLGDVIFTVVTNTCDNVSTSPFPLWSGGLEMGAVYGQFSHRFTVQTH